MQYIIDRSVKNIVIPAPLCRVSSRLFKTTNLSICTYVINSKKGFPINISEKKKTEVEVGETSNIYTNICYTLKVKCS